MINIYIITILIILVISIFYLINNYDNNISNLDKKCNLENFNIDNIHIIKRDPYYQKLINNLVDEKAFLFTENEIDILKNKFQIYNVSDNNIQNISKVILSNCKDNLDHNSSLKNVSYTPDTLAEIKYNLDNNSIYNKIVNKFTKDIDTLTNPNCENIKFLQSNKLKNYYYDIFGNNIISSPIDYMANYYTSIANSNDKIAIPVKTIKGNSNFIIPNSFINTTPFQGSIQNNDYFNNNHNTNIYNIDNARIINPLLTY